MTQKIINKILPMENLPTIYITVNNNNDFLEKINYPKNLLITNITTTSNFSHQDDIVNFLTTECQYYFYVDENIIISNPNVLLELLSLDRDVIAPMILCKSDSAWSNFWGDINENGYYKKSSHYLDIVNSVKKGCWNVPYIADIYLIKRNIIEQNPNVYTSNNYLEIDMRMCHNFRENNILMYVTNMSEFGYFNFEPYTESKQNINININTDINIQDLLLNKSAWEEKYLHPEYFQNKDKLDKLRCVEVCYDVFNFPLFSQAFCDELIAMIKTYGKWSHGEGNHYDPRLGENYYENFPTTDIHLFEIKLDVVWESIVHTYIAPMAKYLYSGYKTKNINISFIVKYDVNGQKELEAHHDASTYTVNIALNQAGIDYQGGGCRFIRQNYTLNNQDPGMCCIHPGRLTHYHEGLPVTAGTRYILVSFIN